MGVENYAGPLLSYEFIRERRTTALEIYPWGYKITHVPIFRGVIRLGDLVTYRTHSIFLPPELICVGRFYTMGNKKFKPKEDYTPETWFFKA